MKHLSLNNAQHVCAKFKAVLCAVLIGFWSLACEDVVEVDVPSEEPRLIVDAITRVDLNSPNTTVRVKVRLTSSFFGTIPVTGLTDISFGNIGEDRYEGGVGGMTENPNEPGTYEVVVVTEGLLEGRLILQMEHEGRLYFARTRFAPAAPINSIDQGTGTLFDDEDTEIIISFTDDGELDNFYVFDLDFGEFLVSDDTFYQGQDFSFSYFYDEKLEPGREVAISILGADQEFHNYMNLIIEQTQEDFGVFQTPVATIRGNVFDVTDLDNIDVFDNVAQPELFPLGYFAVVEEFKSSIVIE